MRYYRRRLSKASKLHHVAEVRNDLLVEEVLVGMRNRRSDYTNIRTCRIWDHAVWLETKIGAPNHIVEEETDITT